MDPWEFFEALFIPTVLRLIEVTRPYTHVITCNVIQALARLEYQTRLNSHVQDAQGGMLHHSCPALIIFNPIFKNFPPKAEAAAAFCFVAKNNYICNSPDHLSNLGFKIHRCFSKHCCTPPPQTIRWVSFLGENLVIIWLFGEAFWFRSLHLTRKHFLY